MWKLSDLRQRLCRVFHLSYMDLFGMLFFVTTCDWGFSHSGRSIYAGHHDSSSDHANNRRSVAVLFRILTGKEALDLEPENLRTVFHIVLPSAVPGILAGVILAIGRIVGETAALDLYGRYGSPGTFKCDWDPDGHWQFICIYLRVRAFIWIRRMQQQSFCWCW